MNFLMKKLLQAKLKGVPVEYQEKLINAMEKNPALFKKIAEETQEKIKGGKDQTAAATEVMGKYKLELQEILK